MPGLPPAPTRPGVVARRGMVTSADLHRLSDIHALLFALDDPGAALDAVSNLCEKIPALGERVLDLATRGNVRPPRGNLRGALQAVGNRGLERVLLELLEDLTILKSDLDAAPPPKR